MNILFLTITRFSDINANGIYTDLMRKFKNEGHKVYVVTPSERRYNEEVGLIDNEHIQILKVKTLNIQKTNIIEKGIATLTIEGKFLREIKSEFDKIKFDLILYTTPPITFSKVIKFIKKRDGALSYLLLKDIFPQNAVDLGMLKYGGFLHRFFNKKEKVLYDISDFIGCMSPANVSFLIKNNPSLDANKIEVNPNSIEPFLKPLKIEEKINIRTKFNIPVDHTVFIYGGNLGKPQGIDFLVDVLLSNKGNSNVFFVIVGGGTEYHLIEKALKAFEIKNAFLLKSLPKKEYNELLLACDIGLIFLDKRFTIPNFPSRILSYMEARMPILAATDKNTDVGKILEENELGLWVESGNLDDFNQKLQQLIISPANRINMGINSYQFLLDNYCVKHTYQIIMNKISNV
ncbi:glycosyltransferase involved in cell wall biosynthesis [Pedobacter sp. CG_S7]|uniref:glycosyltransferase family 4 protein n=1 Tax=Pedobacter sp. CG_S7 TaxID=3143930 RepID=UPI0033929702